jgi:membrane fusion protein (multidrug efflux system)
MKKIPNWITITILIALLIGSKFIFFAKKDEKAGAGGKGKGPAAPVAVNYYVVKQTGYSNDVFTTGKIGAFEQVDILPEVNGKVTAIYFKEGETVSKGSLMVKLNDADLQAQLLKTRTQLKLADQKLIRLKKLLDIKGVSQEEYDMQENDAASLKADEAYLQAQIAKTSIVAPFSGVIGLRNISEGAYVSASTPIVSLVQLKPVYIEFSMPEKYTDLMHKGLPVTFASENVESSKTFSAQIYAIEPKVDEATKTIKARAMYNGDKELLPGSFVKVYVNLGKNDNALMVPTECVIPTLKGQKVFVNHGGIAAEVMISTGVRTDRLIQVTEGLNAGDTVITTGLMSVKKEAKLKLLKSVN